MIISLLFIFGLSDPDSTIDLCNYVYYLILTDEGAIINQTTLNQTNFTTIFSTNTISNGTIHLNLDVILDPSDDYLQLVIKSITQTPYNLNMILKNAHNTENSMDIYFADIWDVKNIINFTFHTDIDLTYSPPSNINIKTFSINDEQIIAQILPENQRNSCTICYYSDQCSQYSVQNNESFLTAKNFNFLNKISSIFEKSESLKFLLTDTETLDELPYIDWREFNFFDTKPKLEFIGLIQGTPSKFDLSSFTDTFPQFIIENVQFVNVEDDESLQISIDEVFVKNTNNVFPDIGTFSIKTTHEYRKSDSGESPFQKIGGIEMSIFEIFPDFETNGDLTITVNKETIDITKSDNSIVAIIPSLNCQKRMIYITHQTNPNKNKFIIRPGTDVEELFDMKIENSDHFKIEISDWDDSKYVESKITFYSNDLEISTTNSYLTYTHYDLEGNILNDNSNKYSSYSFCLGSEKCNTPNLQQSQFLQIPILGDNVSDIISNLYDFLDQHKSIVDVCLILNTQFNDQSFDLESHLSADSFNSIIFYGGDDRKNITKVNLLSLPSVEGLTLNIWNCLVDIKFNCSVNDLMLTDNGSYVGDNLTYLGKTSIQYIDISSSDVEISVYENEIDCLGAMISIDSVYILILTVGNSPHQIIFDTKAAKPTSLSFIFISNGENNGIIPISITDSWSQLPEGQYGSIDIVLYDQSNIVYKSINSKVKVSVSNILMQVLSQIPAGCAQDKIVNCYNNDYCIAEDGFTINDDEFYIATRSDEEFSYLIDLIKSNPDKQYQYLRLVISETSEIKFQDIPSEHISQIQLYRMTAGKYQSVTLSSDIDTENIKSLLVNQVRFEIESTTKLFQFQELVVVDVPSLFPSETSDHYNIKINVLRLHCIKDHSYSGLDKYYDRSDYVVYELFTDLENNDYIVSFNKNSIYVNTALDNYYSCDCSFPNVDVSKSYFLIHGSNVSDYELIFNRYDDSLTQANCVIDNETAVFAINFTCQSDVSGRFTLNVYTFNDEEVQIESGNCNQIESKIIRYPFESTSESGSEPEISPIISNDYPSSDESKNDEGKNDPETNIASSSNENIENYSTNDKSEREESNNDYSSSEENKDDGNIDHSSNEGHPNHSSIIESKNENIDDRSLSESITHSPQSFPEAPIPGDTQYENTNSSSSSFELTDNGFISQEIGEEKSEKTLNKSPTKINTITFSQTEISITESGSFSSSTPLYFVALQPSSTITISKQVTHSNIGIASTNNPTVHLQKSDNPLSFMNNVSDRTQYIRIIAPQSDDDGNSITQLNLRDINNHHGDFSLIVSPSVALVSFTSLLMSQKSSFSIESSSNSKVLDENAGPVAQVKETIDVSPSSEASFYNVEIDGKLSVYDDSNSIFNSNSKFSEKSKIEVNIKKAKTYSKDDTPLIYFEGTLNSIPSEIVLSSNDSINVFDLPVLSSDNFDKCEELANKIVFKSGKEGKIEPKCTDVDGLRVLLVTADENHQNDKKKNKLGAGAIAGIIIACAVVIAIIIALAIYLKKRKKVEHTHTGDEETDDYMDL